MPLPPISEAQIRRGASGESFARGAQLYQHGAVGALVLRGGLLQIAVTGSQGAPYQVTVRFDAQGLPGATCTCPYDWGGWCKHIVAALLAYAGAAPDAVAVRPTLAEAVAAADRDHLAAALLRLAQDDPDLVETIDALLRAPLPDPVAAAPDDLGDPEAIRRQVQRALARPRPDDDAAAAAIVEALQPLVDDLSALVAAGAADRALPPLAALTEVLIPQWHTYADPEAELAFFLDDLGLLWADALLTAELTPAARAGWRQRLAGWRQAPGSRRVDGLVRGELAAAEGWDAPWLAPALRGETPAGTLTLAPESTELISLRLAVLGRRGRAEEALHLATAAGDVAAQTRLLVRLGRGAEAVQVGLAQLRTADEALALGGALQRQGDVAAALAIGAHGLGLGGGRAGLGRWLLELAAERGEVKLAIKAGAEVLRVTPSLALYQRLAALAGADWPRRRERVLALVGASRDAFSAAERVAIFLHEGRIDDAITLVERGAHAETRMRVLAAAVATRPDWVIATAIAQAEPIMRLAGAAHSEEAGDLLRLARDAYAAAGRGADWAATLAGIRSRYGRQHKLMALLSRLEPPEG